MPQKIKPLNLLGLEPNMAKTSNPNFEWVKPKDLLVDDRYQRNLRKESITLIRKIISGWDWARFKPPICALTPAGLEVIDGQHTAIAAASHPGIDHIPVMVIDADQLEDRARAFVGHNRDRIALTQAQMHYAALAAGDEDAQTLQNVCNNAGVELLRYPLPEYRVGQTQAYVTIRSLIKRRGAMNARIVLQALVEARLAPLPSDLIKATEELLFSNEYKKAVSAKSVSNEILRLGPKLQVDAAVFAHAHGVQNWRALAVVLFRGAKRKQPAPALAPAPDTTKSFEAFLKAK